MGRLILAIVFLLVAADPSPRFLGINRLPTPPRAASLPAEKIRTLLPSYDLPALSLRTSEDGSAHGALAAALPAARAPFAAAPSDRDRSVRGAALATPVAAGRNGAGPPLRC